MHLKLLISEVDWMENTSISVNKSLSAEFIFAAISSKCKL